MDKHWRFDSCCSCLLDNEKEAGLVKQVKQVFLRRPWLTLSLSNRWVSRPPIQRLLTCQERRSITVRLISYLTCLDSTIQVKMLIVQHKQSSRFQASQTVILLLVSEYSLIILKNAKACQQRDTVVWFLLYLLGNGLALTERSAVQRYLPSNSNLVVSDHIKMPKYNRGLILAVPAVVNYDRRGFIRLVTGSKHLLPPFQQTPVNSFY